MYRFRASLLSLVKNRLRDDDALSSMPDSFVQRTLRTLCDRLAHLKRARAVQRSRIYGVAALPHFIRQWDEKGT
jgi:hypothetical protein